MGHRAWLSWGLAAHCLTLSACSLLSPVSQPTGDPFASADRTGITQVSFDETAEGKVPPLEFPEPDLATEIPPTSEPIENSNGSPIEPVTPATSLIPGQPLTLAELEAVALSKNPTLAAAQAEIDKTRGAWQHAGMPPNPFVGYSAEDMGIDGSAGVHGIYVTRTFIRGNKLALNQAVAAELTQQATWNAQVQRLKVQNDLRQQYWRTLGAQQKVELTKQLEKLAKETVDVGKTLVENDQLAPLELMDSEMALTQVSLQVSNAEAAARAEWSRLMSLIGESSLPPAPLTEPLGDLPGELDQASLYADLLNSTPELMAAQANVRHAHAQLQRECVQNISNVQGQLGVGYDSGSNHAVADLQVQMTLPRANNNQGRKLVAHAQIRRARENVARIKLSLQVRLADALSDYHQARARAIGYETKIIPQLETIVGKIEQAIEQEQFNRVKLLQAQEKVVQVKLLHLQAMTEVKIAEVLLTGMLLTSGLDDVEELPTHLENRDAALTSQ